MMQFLGLRPEDYPENAPVGVWPDNQQAVVLFIEIETQWRSGPAGAYGLDYNVLFQKLDRMNLTAERYARLEQDIKVLECAALDAMHAKGD